MTLQDLINRTRVYTRDFTGSIYRETDIIVFLDEAFNRFSIIPELGNAVCPVSKVVEIELVPKTFQYLLSIYASSRCLLQDEQDYRAGTLMNEFEAKLEELKSLIECGDIIIKDALGNVTVVPPANFVVDEYFDKISYDDDDLI